jgi:putative addiction module killer protein
MRHYKPVNIQYEIVAFETSDGSSPFYDWVESLKDEKVKRLIFRRIQRTRLGNLGDYKSIKGCKGLLEMREHYGAGYRILFSIVEGKVILLLAGSSKRDQERTIAKAKQYLADYERRNTL